MLFEEIESEEMKFFEEIGKGEVKLIEGIENGGNVLFGENENEEEKMFEEIENGDEKLFEEIENREEKMFEEIEKEEIFVDFVMEEERIGEESGGNVVVVIGEDLMDSLKGFDNKGYNVVILEMESGIYGQDECDVIGILENNVNFGFVEEFVFLEFVEGVENEGFFILEFVQDVENLEVVVVKSLELEFGDEVVELEFVREVVDLKFIEDVEDLMFLREFVEDVVVDIKFFSFEYEVFFEFIVGIEIIEVGFIVNESERELKMLFELKGGMD